MNENQIEIKDQFGLPLGAATASAIALQKALAATTAPALSADNIGAYALAGNATFTIVSRKSGVRFTYKITRAGMGKPAVAGTPEDPRYFVKVLTGADNESDYQYLGCIFSDKPGQPYYRGTKSTIGLGAPSNLAFDWFWSHRNDATLGDKIEVHHEGRCGRCGRKLTVPESITSGYGPECIGKLGL